MPNACSPGGTPFRSQAGFLDGTGLYITDPGPRKVITTPGLMGYELSSRRMRVDSLHPGVTSYDICSNTGFEMLFCEMTH